MAETNKSLYLSEFLFYVGFKTSKEKFDAFVLPDKIKTCAYQAYLDFCRTVKYDHYKKTTTGEYIINGKKKIKYNDKDWKKQTNQLLELFFIGDDKKFPQFKGLIAGIKALLNAANRVEYDNRHKSLCNSLCTIKHSILEKRLTIGQAQKWVNMTMKYLWMLDLVECDSAFLHIPIDNYVLGELKQTIDDSDKLIEIVCNQYFVIDKKSKKSYKWSNVSDYETGYFPIQEAIRVKKQCPIEWEFSAWLEAAQKEIIKEND